MVRSKHNVKQNVAGSFIKANSRGVGTAPCSSWFMSLPVYHCRADLAFDTHCHTTKAFKERSLPQRSATFFCRFFANRYLQYCSTLAWAPTMQQCGQLHTPQENSCSVDSKDGAFIGMQTEFKDSDKHSYERELQETRAATNNYFDNRLIYPESTSIITYRRLIDY